MTTHIDLAIFSLLAQVLKSWGNPQKHAYQYFFTIPVSSLFCANTKVIIMTVQRNTEDDEGGLNKFV